LVFGLDGKPPASSQGTAPTPAPADPHQN
jgi:hypothetical protein